MFVVTVRVNPVTWFLAVIVTPGMTPPVGSMTVPRIVAAVRWAKTGAAAARSAATRYNRVHLIGFLLLLSIAIA